MGYSASSSGRFTLGEKTLITKRSRCGPPRPWGRFEEEMWTTEKCLTAIPLTFSPHFSRSADWAILAHLGNRFKVCIAGCGDRHSWNVIIRWQTVWPETNNYCGVLCSALWDLMGGSSSSVFASAHFIRRNKPPKWMYVNRRRKPSLRSATRFPFLDNNRFIGTQNTLNNRTKTSQTESTDLENLSILFRPIANDWNNANRKQTASFPASAAK